MPLKRTVADMAADARRRIDEIDPDELAERLGAGAEPPLVIDVREESERAAGFIPGSVHVSRGVLERDIEKAGFGGVVRDADLARPIVCYCKGGQRSLLAADTLKSMGFTNVLSLRGGFTGWATAGGHVEQGKRS
ncbi:MAG: rhodanese-like domain-containing protein [Planctomycetota bacterium]|nr:rhodanese-like domain-containing protein [Planctomycetota bacterium]